MTERRTILFLGRVQGVGFRMTTVQFAEAMALAGTVRNVDDGGVELVVEGKTAEIDVLVSRLREHFGSFIRNVKEASAPPTGHFSPGIRISH